MRGVIIALAVALTGACATDSRAEMPASCRVVEHQLDRETGLPRVAKAIADKQLNILVIGAGSSSLPGSGANKAYPARLEAAPLRVHPYALAAYRDANGAVRTDSRSGRVATAKGVRRVAEGDVHARLVGRWRRALEHQPSGHRRRCTKLSLNCSWANACTCVQSGVNQPP